MANSNKPKLNRAGNTGKVSMMDVCQTPPHALEPLYPHLERMGFTVIWESAHGPEQLLVHELDRRGYHVWASDLSDGEEYNRFTYRAPYYHIEITNVPFSIKYDWLAQAFSDGKPFAFLVPYETTFAKDFQDLFTQYNHKPWAIEVLSPERRINYKMPNMGWGIRVWDEKKQKMVNKGDSAQMPTMWLTWGLEVWQTEQPFLRTYYVPMRSVKYDSENNPIVKDKNGRKKETWQT